MLEQLTTSIQQMLGESTWAKCLCEIVFIFGGIFLVNFGLKRILNFLYNKAKASKISPVWGIQIILKAYVPLTILFWITGISYIVEILSQMLSITTTSEVTHKLRAVAWIISNGWLLFQWKQSIQYSLIEEEKRKGTLALHYTKIDLFSKIVSILLVVMITLTVLSKLEYPLEGVLTVGGAVAAAAGFAARDVGANFFGGLMTYLTQPFALGNRIKLPNNNIEGHVERIGWYFTLIRNSEQQPIYVPNSIFTNNTVINLHRIKLRRFQETINVHYRDMENLDKITDKVYKMLITLPEIDKNNGPLVAFIKFNQSSLDLQVTAFTTCIHTSDFLKLQQRILLNIGQILEESDAELAYPARNYYGVDSTANT